MKRIFVFLMAILACLGCESIFTAMGEKVDVDGGISHDMIVLGSQLDDPFSVDNMTKALEALYPTKADRVPIEPTDIYVRFLPEGDGQYERLEELGVQMLDHPLDYEIVKEGDYYHDPDIPEGEITWQYAVVPVGFDFPDGIRYEVLDNCYIAENSATKADWVDWDAVEREAYRITGNAGMLSEGTKAGGDTPSGKIQIKDGKYSSEPFGVKGVKVSCNSFVKFAHAFTDEDGNYTMSRSFSGDPRYRIVFKNRKGFAIGFNLLLIPASISTLGKGSPEGVSICIDKDSERKLFSRSVVNNAGYDYFESCEKDGVKMKTPPANLRFWLFQHLDASSAIMLQQGAVIDGSLLEDFLGEYCPLLQMFLPDITLGLKGCDSYDTIYASAIHEMAHASHYMLVGNDYWNTFIKFIITSFVTSGFVTYGVGTEKNHGYCEVGEMWAYYLQSRMYQDRYPGSGAVFGTTFWFSPQIFMQLDERGLGRFKIFNALSRDVTDRESLQDKLVSLYPEMKSTINQAFGRYN